MTKAHAESKRRIQQAAQRIEQLVAQELTRSSQARKRQIEAVYASLVVHAGKLALTIPRLSIFYDPQQYLDNVHLMVKQLVPEARGKETGPGKVPQASGAEEASQAQTGSAPMGEPVAMLTTQQAKNILKQAGLPYHQRDRQHRVVRRGLEVRPQSRQGGVVLVEFALSISELRDVGDEYMIAEIRQALSRAKEVLENAGLRVEYVGTTGMALAASVKGEERNITCSR